MIGTIIGVLLITVGVIGVSYYTASYHSKNQKVEDEKTNSQRVKDFEYERSLVKWHESYKALVSMIKDELCFGVNQEEVYIEKRNHYNRKKTF